MKIENVNVHMRAEMDKYIIIVEEGKSSLVLSIDGNRASLQNSNVVIYVYDLRERILSQYASSSYDVCVLLSWKMIYLII